MNKRIQNDSSLVVKKRLITEFKQAVAILLALLVLFLPLASNAHSGRTDSSGGHRDNNNKSGLGSYHYHHGYGPHLHTNGECPYSVTTKDTKKSTSTNAEKSISLTKSKIIQIQEKLNKLGYDCGKADGVIGNKTKAAIKAFQKEKGLVVDGVIGSKTLKALGL
ncbi:peptidoglycan-binding protein [Ruminiclostridium herbifermentans]|uniref:Peptidoglycan-binding protein n=2 Tax=Ruminiclostridium herbifermentans TaxID=2488810 RepID=A0A4U7JFZ1_9FIRM|nr:peptidoglycan-binding protein [Ruminiclostridium herbifermentans]